MRKAQVKIVAYDCNENGENYEAYCKLNITHLTLPLFGLNTLRCHKR